METKATGTDLGISTKNSIVICDFIRGKKLGRAKILLNDVIEMKKAVPFGKFHKDKGHKTGMMAGRYPIKSCKEILNILHSAEANAKDKNMDVDALVVKEIKANKASTPLHYGRFRSRRMKRTHIEVVLSEIIKKEQKDTK